MSKPDTPDIVDLRRSLGRIYLDDFEGVTLAVFLASELETGDGKELSETGWEVEALAKMELLLDLIHQHYAPTIAQVVSRAEKAEAELAKHQWRTMESAPRDGSLLIVFRPVEQGENPKDANVGLDFFDPTLEQWWRSRHDRSRTGGVNG